MCCNLELKTLNNRKMTESLQNHWKRHVCSNSCIWTTQQYFFQQSFARSLKNISPIVWYCCNIWCPYKISNILYKTDEKAVSFYQQHLACHVIFPERLLRKNLFACTFTADDSILHERVCYFLYIFFCWVMGLCHPSDITTINMSQFTLRASLSSTFLQTLLDLVTSLKGHYLSRRSCPPAWSALSERFGC